MSISWCSSGILAILLLSGILLMHPVLLAAEPSLVEARAEAGRQLVEALRSPLVHGYFIDTFIEPKVGGAAILAPPAAYEDVIGAGKECVPYLIDALEDTRPYLRTLALLALHEITHVPVGDYECLYRDSLAHHQQRARLTAKWKKWWQENGGKSRTEWLIDRVHTGGFAEKTSAIRELSVEDDSAVPPLRELLRSCDRRIQPHVIYSLASLGDKTMIPLLIDLFLASADDGIRYEGVTLLRSLTGEAFGYKHEAPIEARQKAVEAWRAWWQENGDAVLKLETASGQVNRAVDETFNAVPTEARTPKPDIPAVRSEDASKAPVKAGGRQGMKESNMERSSDPP